MLEFLGARDGFSDQGLYLYGKFDEAPESVPYAEFPGRVAASADFLRDHGVRPGSRVLFPFETSAEVILSFFALMEIGALPLCVKPFALSTPLRTYEEFLDRIARDHGADHVLAVPSLAPVALPAPALPLPPAGPPASGARRVPAVLRVPGDEETAFVQFSSGSTSFPKGIPILHGRLRANLGMITRTDGRVPGDRVSSWLPLYHDMGLVGGMLSCFRVGCDLLLADPTSFLFDARGWWEHLSAERVMGTVIPNFAIDYSLRMMADADPAELAELDLSRIRAVYLGSEPINIPNLEAFTALMEPSGLRSTAFMPCYGMAEAVLLVSSREPGQGVRTVPAPSGVPAVCVGRPMPEFTVRVRDGDGRVCGENELGLIELSGGSLATAYLGRSGTLAGDDGFYPTGDIGFLDGGELFVTGRDGDRIKVNGQSLFAADFEQAVERLPFVRQGRTAVVESGGNILVLTDSCRETRQDTEGCRTRVVDQLVRTLGVTVRPQDVHFLRPGQLPRTSSGKLRRRAVLEAYEGGRLRGPTLPEPAPEAGAGAGS
ncbi:MULTISPECIES: AMP-binding protein [unclassified Streptomyces]|uniref:AMP-binding protein n=1 Tax=unclassified Streptomyces TaxID=2593676 RepID=UPI002237A3E2|nr:AMP-binding protein [Streptomyces sp. SHP 1-2]MCW5253395.1 AMP-binding protein [Streptomyces sp. SHP 1-2]